MFRSKRGSADSRANAQYTRTRRRKRIREEERQRRRDQQQRREERERQEEITGATAAERFAQRQRAFAQRHGRVGAVIHRSAWWTHNCVAHPLLGLAPRRLSLRLHDATADWLNLSEVVSQSPTPRIPRRRDWVMHNCVAHPLMGLFPGRSTFAFHEATAERMAVSGWV